MSAVSEKSEREVVWAFIKKSSPSDLDLSHLELSSNKKSIAFVLAILELFGTQYLGYIHGKIRDQTLKSQLAFSQAILLEIQNNLLDSIDSYSSDSFPKTMQLMNSHLTSDPNALFEILRVASYQMLPFPQRVITYPVQDAKLLNAIEQVREATFKLLVNILEKKEVQAFDQLKLVKLLYSQEALPKRSYAEMLTKWASTSREKTEATNKLFNALEIAPWLKPEEIAEEKSSVDTKEVTFSDFLLNETVRTFEDNFTLWFKKNITALKNSHYQFRFSSATIQRLKKQITSETIRSDLALFGTDLDTLIKMDPKKINPSLIGLFALIKEFIHWIKQYEITQEKYQELLEILVLSNPSDIINPQTSKEQFTKAWNHFKSLLNLCANQQKQTAVFSSSSSAAAAAAAATSSPRTAASDEMKMAPVVVTTTEYHAPLFLFLLKNDQLDIYIYLFNQLAQINGMQLTPQRIHLFCAENPKLNDEQAKPLIQKILHLLNDFSHLKIKAECIAEVLTIPIGMGFDPNIKEQAKGMLASLNEAYSFTDSQQFSLYIEFTKLITDNKLEKIIYISKFINRLEEFCPALNLEIIYTLYRYHPDAKLEFIDQLEEIKGKYIHQNRKTFILDPAFSMMLNNQITLFCDSLKSTSPEQDEFYSKLYEAVLYAFFPPSQLATDFFKIAGMNPIQWNSDFLTNQEGRFRSVYDHSKLRAYLHWQMVAGSPVLFFSFSDEHSATSRFIRMNGVSDLDLENRRQSVANKAEEKDGNPEGREFFGALRNLGEHIFNEEVKVLKPSQDSQKKQTHPWVDYFPGLSQALAPLNEAYREGLLDFAVEARLAWRNLYLQQTMHQQPYHGKSSLHEASLGNIYHSKKSPRGILIPKHLEDLEAHKEFYRPNISEMDVGHVQRVFSNPTNDFEPLTFIGKKLELILSKDGLKETQYPIEFRVRKEYTTMRISIEKSHIELPMQYPPEILASPALFLERFDRHTLFLKALYYYHISVKAFA